MSVPPAPPPRPPYTKLDPKILAKYEALPSEGAVIAEYVWLGGNREYRSKARTLARAPRALSELPIWNYDGSSTGQAPGTDSEVLIKPVAMFPDPFRGAPHILVLCENYKPAGDGGLGEPLELDGAFGNSRRKCEEIHDKVKASKPWYGLEQEYMLYEPSKPGHDFNGSGLRGQAPYGWPYAGMPAPQGPYCACPGVWVHRGGVR